MASVSDLVSAALREIGVQGAGETLGAEDGDDALDAFNRMVDQWAAERLMIYESARTTKALVNGTRDYTVGVGGDFNVARPVYVDHVTYYDSTTTPLTEIDLTPLTDDAWEAIPQKATTSPSPAFYYYQPTMPTATLSLWPVLTGATLVGVLYAPKQISEFAALATAVSLPPGYRRTIVKNLALELAPSYRRTPAPELLTAAADAKAVVKRQNVRMTDLGFDYGVDRFGYDIRTG